MAYQLHDQYIDSASNFHVIELRDERGNKHLLQIAIGHEACPLCGHATVRDHEDIDVKAITADVISTLGESENAIKAHAARHGVRIK